MELSSFNLEAGFKGAFQPGEKPGIVVIDFQKAFTHPDLSPLASTLDPTVIDKTNEIIQEGRKHGVPIYFTAVGYEKHMNDAGLWFKKCHSLKDLKLNSELIKVDDRFNYSPDEDIYIIKKYASAFFGTSLFSMLTAEKIDTLIVIGTTTSGCVRATVVDAMQYGFVPIVVRDCVVDRDPKQHESNLIDMGSKYAEVYSYQNTLDYLKSL